MSLELRKLVDEAEVKPKSREEVLELRGPINYGLGRTKQSFKDTADINKIIKKAQRTGSLAFAQKYDTAEFGVFDGEMDLLTARERLEAGNKVFQELPSEVRREFDNDALKFFAFANDPANVGRLEKLLPAIAEPGPYKGFGDARRQAADAAQSAESGKVEAVASATEKPSEDGSSAV